MVQYTTKNPAYEEGRKMWKAVTIIFVIIAIVSIF